MNLTRLGMAAMAVALPLTLLPIAAHSGATSPSVVSPKIFERGDVAKDRVAQCRMPTAIRFRSVDLQRLFAITPMSHASRSVTPLNGDGAGMGMKARRVCHRSHSMSTGICRAALLAVQKNFSIVFDVGDPSAEAVRRKR